MPFTRRSRVRPVSDEDTAVVAAALAPAIALPEGIRNAHLDALMNYVAEQATEVAVDVVAVADSPRHVVQIASPTGPVIAADVEPIGPARSAAILRQLDQAKRTAGLDITVNAEPADQ